MTDGNDNDGGRSGGRKGPRRPGTSGGDRPFRKPAGAKPFRARDGEDRPFRKPAGEKRPFRARDGEERPFRKPTGDRPFRPRDGEERPFRKPAGERPFRARDGEERPFRKPAGDRPFRPREGEERPFRKPAGDRPFRPRDGEERPFRKPAGEKRPFSPRDGEGRPFRKPAGERAHRAPEGASRSFRPRDGDERPVRPRREAPPQREPRPEPALAPEPVEERIAKTIARAGIASRRDAEAMIAEGRVTLNGEVLTSPAVNIGPDDVVTVDGEPLPARERTRLWLFHKPRGLVTTARDPEGRPTVFESLPEEMPRVVAIGRLDINTEGLLLLTNDGGLAKVIAHPDTGWLRRYRVRAHGEVTQEDLDRFADGVTIDGMEYGPIEARLDRAQGDNVWITLGLREGKNREVKRILEHIGLQVNRLIRLSFGPFQLGDIEAGLVEEVRTKVLKDQLGASLAAEAGVDFESPVREPIAPFGTPGVQPREERPHRRAPPAGRDERPHRHPPAPAREERPKYDRFAPKRSIWRAGEEDGPPQRKGPRRDDPRRARTESGERPRERAGTIARGDRTVRVERLVSQPADVRPPRRPAPSADDRPRRPSAPFRSRGDEDRAGPSRGGPKGKPGGGKRPPGPKGPPRGRR